VSKVLTFTYFPRPFKDSETGRESEIFLPIIPIKVSCKKQLFKANIDSLVDSGCDRSLFPGVFLKGMGVDISKGGKKGFQQGISQQGITAYAHKVNIYIEGRAFETVIDFSDEYNSIPLLGRSAFFRLFKKIIFNEKAKKLKLVCL